MYKVIPVDLSVVTPANGTTIVEQGQTMDELFVLLWPTNAVMEIALGLTSDFFFVGTMFAMEPQGDDLAANSLRYRNLIAQPGLAVQVVVVFGGNKLATTIN